MNKVAQISYADAPRDMTIALHVSTYAAHENGLCQSLSEITYRDIPNKPAALALCKRLGAKLV